MNIDYIITKYNALEAEMQRQRQMIVDGLKPEFFTIFEDTLNKYPDILAFSWTQYTPYFNDGDECVFSANDICSIFKNVEYMDDKNLPLGYEAEEFTGPYNLKAVVNTVKNGNYDVPYYNYSWKGNTKEDTKRYVDENIKKYMLTPENIDAFVDMVTAAKEINKLVADIPQALMLGMFGDHVSVLVTRKGIDIDEYDHD